MKTYDNDMLPQIGARVHHYGFGRCVVKRTVVSNEGRPFAIDVLPVKGDQGSGRRGRKWRLTDLARCYIEHEGMIWARGWTTRAAKLLQVERALRAS